MTVTYYVAITDRAHSFSAHEYCGLTVHKSATATPTPRCTLVIVGAEVERVGAIYASAVEWSGGPPLPIPQSASAPDHLDFLNVGVGARLPV